MKSLFGIGPKRTFIISEADLAVALQHKVESGERAALVQNIRRAAGAPPDHMKAVEVTWFEDSTLLRSVSFSTDGPRLEGKVVEDEMVYHFNQWPVDGTFANACRVMETYVGFLRGLTQAKAA